MHENRMKQGVALRGSDTVIPTHPQQSARINRRQMLAGSALAAATCATAVAAPRQRLIIDTHLEVWTLDPKFPFNHPESGPNLKVEVAAPIENQVEQMRDFSLRYAVLINPRY